MREIKFRAKLADGTIIYSDDFMALSVFFERVSAEGLEVEQYTGQIHEKREVFEGDVFQHPDGVKFFVKWDQGHCSFRANYYDDNLTSLLISQLDKNRGGAKYIGTIHEK